MEKERIEELIAKPSLTVQERAEVRGAADRLGIRYNIKQGCRGCYERLMLEVFEALSGNGSLAVSADGYQFRRPGQSFMAGGVVYDEYTLPGLSVGGLHPVIVSTYFVKKSGEAAVAGTTEGETDGTED